MNGVHTEAKRLPEKIKNAREALLREGRRFLMENQDGRYGKFSVRELTARCGMASGTYYHYFGSKDELVLEIMETDWEKVMDGIRPVASMGCSLRDKAEVIYDLLTDFERRYYLSVMNLMSPTPKNLERRHHNEQRLYSLVCGFLAAETERGELVLEADCDSAAYLFIQLILAAGRNPDMDFDKMWKCMNFLDGSAPKK
jgi:AcrR family transcriptional regulator